MVPDFFKMKNIVQISFIVGLPLLNFDIVEFTLVNL